MVTPTSINQFVGYARRRTQDINEAGSYGYDRIFEGTTAGQTAGPLGEPPWDGYTYSVKNGVWVRDPIQNLPPNDGNVYGYTPAGWVNINNMIINIDLDAGYY